MSYSKYIDRIVRLLEAAHVDVELHAFDLPCSGMYRSEVMKVFINEPNARQALKTIAHEAGHWLGYAIFGIRPESYQRERQAFVYGWRVLGMVGARGVISREEWIASERERRISSDVDTSDFRRTL